MQHTDELNMAGKRGSRSVAALIAVISMAIMMIIGLTTIKIIKIENTQIANCKEFKNGFPVERMLANEIESTVQDNVYVKIGGRPIGISINAGGLIVLGKSEVLTENGTTDPAAKSGLQVGDVITKVDGNQVSSIFQLKKMLENAGETVGLTVKRGDDSFETHIKPEIDSLTAQKKLGLLLKEDVGGVGTLTFVTTDGKFGALGHYIADGDSGLSRELSFGHIYATSIDGVIKGERGQAGGLVADVNRLSDPIGDIKKNTQIGIFGDFTADYDGTLFRIAESGEAKMGPAKVFTTIDGTQPKFYDIDIVKVVPQSEAGEKGMVIAVRDKELLEKTGGIVQGMSGSPIVQDGILIGAVTHVFVQDPTRGYAVHSRFMYDYAAEASALTQLRAA